MRLRAVGGVGEDEEETNEDDDDDDDDDDDKDEEAKDLYTIARHSLSLG